MIDVGDTVRLRWQPVDADGQPVEPLGVTVTITLPDGTTVTPTPQHPSPELYQVDHVATVPGRHTVRWAGTGPAVAFVDGFNVHERAGVVSLEAAREHLGLSADDTAYDEQIRRLIRSATGVLEDHVGMLVPRTFIERHSGGVLAVSLRRSPVMEVITVVESGATLTAGVDYSLSDHGTVTRLAGGYPGRFLYGTHNIVVTYRAGREVIDPKIIDAALELVRVNMRPIQGGNYSPFDSNPPPSDDERRRVGFWVPQVVLAHISGELLPPGMA